MLGMLESCCRIIWDKSDAEEAVGPGSGRSGLSPHHFCRGKFCWAVTGACRWLCYLCGRGDAKVASAWSAREVSLTGGVTAGTTWHYNLQSQLGSVLAATVGSAGLSHCGRARLFQNNGHCHCPDMGMSVLCHLTGTSFEAIVGRTPWFQSRCPRWARDAKTPGITPM